VISDYNLQANNKNEDENNGNNDGLDDESTSMTTADSDRANAHILWEMHHLSGWFNPIANEVIDRAEAANKTTSNKSDNATHQSGREVANAIIELSPSQFAFYANAGVIDTNLNFEEAFKQIPLEPTTFREAYDHLDPEQ